MDQAFITASRQRRHDEVRAEIVRLQNCLITVNRHFQRIVAEAPNDDVLCAELDELAEDIRFEARALHSLRSESWSSHLAGQVERIEPALRRIEQRLSKVADTHLVKVAFEAR